MRRFSSPAGLFAIWSAVLAILFLTPIVGFAFAHHRLAAPPPRLAPIAARRIDLRYGRLLALATTCYLLSFPIFAVLHGRWKRLFGADLGRMLGYVQFGFAVAPMLLGPVIAALVLSIVIAAHPPMLYDGAAIRTRPAFLPLIVFVVFASASWIASLVVFARNVVVVRRSTSSRGTASTRS